MSKTISNIISYLFHPMFVASYGFALILFTDNYFSYFFPLNVKILLLAITLSFTCVLPVFNLYVLKRLRLITSFYLDDGRERTFPYVITSLFYVGMAYLVKDFQISGIYISVIIAAAISIILTAIINLRWKISAHMIGIGGLAGCVLSISFILGQNFLPWFCMVLFAAGLTGFARLKLGKHTPAQVYVGFSLGLLSTFAFIIATYILNLHAIM